MGPYISIRKKTRAPARVYLFTDGIPHVVPFRQGSSDAISESDHGVGNRRFLWFRGLVHGTSASVPRNSETLRVPDISGL
jgi:hypothetical protein